MRDGHNCFECINKPYSIIKNSCLDSKVKSTIYYIISKLNKLILNFVKPTIIWTNKNSFRLGSRSTVFNKLSNQINYTYSSEIKHLSNKKTKTFLYMGRISIDKGCDFLIGEFEEKYGQLILVGSIDSKLKSIIENNSNFTQFDKVSISSINNYYKKASYVIIPSKWVDNLPNTLVEAYSRGIPCIIPNYGSFTEFIVDKKLTFKSINDLKNALNYASSLKYSDYIILKNKVLEVAFEKFNIIRHMKKYDINYENTT